jgi:hypothetical protein
MKEVTGIQMHDTTLYSELRLRTSFLSEMGVTYDNNKEIT